MSVCKDGLYASYIIQKCKIKVKKFQGIENQCCLTQAEI